MRRKRHESLEINLTPLLDVLFSVLFIIIISAGAKSDPGVAKELENNVSNLKEEIQVLEDENKALKEKILIQETENENEKSESPENEISDLTIILINNDEKESKDYLIIDYGISVEELELDQEKSKEAIEDKLDLLVGNNKNICIVFNCDKSKIHTDSYNYVIGLLNKIKDENDSVFLRIKED